MDIYMKPQDKVLITGRRLVFLKDVADFFIGGQSVEGLGDIVVLEIPEGKKKTYLLSSLDLAKAINIAFPKGTVVNLGEMDTLIEYEPQPKKEGKFLTYAKVFFVSLVLFAGAATAIMTFHTDVQIPKIFENFYYIFFKENNAMPLIIAIPYSIGLAVGILVFFNHFGKFYVTSDPTPIEVEMTTYEKETITSIVDCLDKEKKKQKERGGM